MKTLRRRIAAAGLITAVGLVGCQAEPADHGVRPTETAPSPVTSSADPKAVAQTKALDAYRGMWRTYIAATRTADPDHPDLGRYATGRALRILQSGVQQLKDKGLHTKGDVVIRPEVDALEPERNPTKASIGDCVDTSKTSAYKTNGEPYKDTPGGRRAMAATVEDIGGGTWKVVSFGLQAVGTC